MHLRNTWVGLLAVAVSAVWCGGMLFAEDKVDLKAGDKAPKFEAKDDEGKDWKSEDHVGKHFVVVYFYPADLTRGCTAQACAFRDDMSKLKDKGIEVVGVSGDSVKNHQLFKKEHKLNFTLLADEKGDVAKAFGVPLKEGGKTTQKAGGENVELTRGVTAARWTFVIDKDGKVILKNKEVKPADDSKVVLKAIEEAK